MISIIIPVYNAEKYLQQCIDSILIQNNKNFELLIINDGSTDSSLDILNKYPHNHLNINILNQNRGGYHLRAI